MPDIEWNRNWANNLKGLMDKIEGHYGDHWGNPRELPMLKRVVDDFIAPFVSSEKRALEIGSGGGRWTQFLLDFRHLYCVDLNMEMFYYLLGRFGARPNLSFVQTQGTEVAGIEKASIDYVFSFGTFVHIDVPDIADYLATLRSLVTPDADLVIQYGDKSKPMAAENKGFAENNRGIMMDLLKEGGYYPVREDNITLPHSNVVHFKPLL